MTDPSNQHLFLLDVILKVAVYSKKYGYFLHMPYIYSAPAIILSIFIALSVFTSKRKEIHYMDYETNLNLRGIAIIFLLLGHLSFKILDNPVFLTIGGYYAVIIFLFLSGFGLIKRYGMSNLNWTFWKKRLIRLAIPLWGSILFFLFLDYFIFQRVYSAKQIVLPLLFIHPQDDNWINASAWYVTFILFLYLVYFIVANIKIQVRSKFIALFSLFAIMLLVYHFNKNVLPFFGAWKVYILVFPLSLLIAFSQGKYAFDTYLKNKWLLGTLVLLMSALIFIVDDTYGVSTPFNSFVFVIVLLVAAQLMVQIGYTSRFLKFLGTHSYEIFLIHLPIMMRFDLVLYRGPIYFTFFEYFIIVILLSVILSRTSNYLNSVIFRVS